MASSSRPKLSEKGLLTPDNCVIAFIDLQPQMLFGVTNFDRQSIINLNVCLLYTSPSPRDRQKSRMPSSA